VSQVNDILNSYSYNQLIPYGEIRFTPHPLLNIEGEALTVLSDNEYRGDFKIYGLAQLAILRNQPYNTTFNFAIKTQNLAPPFFYKHFFSNHFKWDNNFSKTFSNQLSAFITQKQIKLGIDFTTLDNYFYIAADTLPAQHKASFQLIKAYLENDFRLGKFDFSGKLFYQKSSNDQVLRVPEFLAYLTFTFNMRFMKGALNTRSGFDLWYNSTYYADAYMPALRSFYLQNEKQIGNFVHADFFINFQVKRTRFFLKTQNILSAFVRHYNYYTVPHYPLQDLGVKFGLDWRFND
ncbi:MAG: putative porin, partial [Bacteroidales bacterium]